MGETVHWTVEGERYPPHMKGRETEPESVRGTKPVTTTYTMSVSEPFVVPVTRTGERIDGSGTSQGDRKRRQGHRSRDLTCVDLVSTGSVCLDTTLRLGRVGSLGRRFVRVVRVDSSQLGLTLLFTNYDIYIYRVPLNPTSNVS